MGNEHECKQTDQFRRVWAAVERTNESVTRLSESVAVLRDRSDRGVGVGLMLLSAAIGIVASVTTAIVVSRVVGG